MTTISKTVFTFTVLHPTNEPLEDLELAISRATDDNAVGYEDVVSTEVLPDDQVESELVALGNDGYFFDHERGIPDRD